MNTQRQKTGGMRLFYRAWVLLLSILAIGTSSCRKLDRDDLRGQIDDNTVRIPESFDFRTSSKVPVSIKVNGNDGKGMKTVPLTISVPKADSFEVIYRGFTDKNGVLNTALSLSQNIDEVLVQTEYLGLPPNHMLFIEELDGYTIANSGREPEGFYQPKGFSASNKKSSLSSKFAYMGTWNSSGVPNYKKHVRDVIPQSFLDDINSSLPERRPVPTYNSQYLADNIETNTIITKRADVWVTFVHEGAGYKNVLGYYTYPVDTPPQSTGDIDSLHIIFPNVSYSGSGGGLVSGDKVHLGKFDPGTAIGWFLIANGYNSGSNTVGNGYHGVFSNKEINPEASLSLRQHNVLLYDETRDVIILGFEDLKRDAGSDDDFNDAIFFVTSNPIEAIASQNLESAKKAIDTDGDGVYDFEDDYPFDPTKSSSSYTPASSTYGSFCFEDSWPNMGDYDFNDLVIDYNYEFNTNAFNDVTSIDATFTVQAIGASYKNGFGLQLDVEPSAVKSVSGQNITENYINLSSNGTESGQSKACIIVFDNAHKQMRRANDATYVNTEKGTSRVDSVVFSITIEFNSGVHLSDLGKAPYNVFLISAATRGREVHMMDYEPTDLANESFFGSGADLSDPNIGRYYQNKENMPWVIHTPTTFNYPAERENIFQCYPYFETWAESEGRTSGDWYQNKPGFVITSRVIIR